MPRSAKNRRGDCFLCGKEARYRCENCKLVFYCSRDHYMSHRQRNYCFPYKIEWNQLGGGHCMIAVRDVKPLELVFFEWNLVTGPTVGQAESNCAECLKVIETPASCAKCSLKMCSELCLSGTNHTAECKAFQNCSEETEPGGKFTKEQLKPMSVMALRLLRSRRANAKVHIRTQFHLQNRDDLNPPNPEVEDDDVKTWVERKAAIVDFISKDCGLDAEEDASEEVEWMVELTRRSAISAPDTAGGGAVIFPTFSLMNHSCVSNCKFVVYPNLTLAVLTQTAVSAGEELNVSLVPVLEPTWKRRAKLMR